MDDPLYGQNLAKKFGIARVPSLFSRFPRRSLVAVSYLARDNPGRINSNVSQDGVAIVFQIEPFNGEIRNRGKTVFRGTLPAGSLMLFDLREEFGGYSSTPCKMVIVYVADPDLSMQLSDKLKPTEGSPFLIKYDDPVAFGLASSLLPSLTGPGRCSQVFFDHVVWAIIRHCFFADGEGPIMTVGDLLESSATSDRVSTCAPAPNEFGAPKGH